MSKDTPNPTVEAPTPTITAPKALIDIIGKAVKAEGNARETGRAMARAVREEGKKSTLKDSDFRALVADAIAKAHKVEVTRVNATPKNGGDPSLYALLSRLAKIGRPAKERVEAVDEALAQDDATIASAYAAARKQREANERKEGTGASNKAEKKALTPDALAKAVGRLAAHAHESGIDLSTAYATVIDAFKTIATDVYGDDAKDFDWSIEA